MRGARPSGAGLGERPMEASAPPRMVHHPPLEVPVGSSERGGIP